MYYSNKLKLIMVKEKTIKFEEKSLNTSDKVFEYIKTIGLQNEPEEVFILISLNVKLKPIGYFEVSRGSKTASIVNVPDVLKRAIISNAYAVVVAHNHPSGDCNPSIDDSKVTNLLKEGFKAVKIELIDHLVIGENNYFSYRENGYM